MGNLNLFKIGFDINNSKVEKVNANLLMIVQCTLVEL